MINTTFAQDVSWWCCKVLVHEGTHSYNKRGKPAPVTCLVLLFTLNNRQKFKMALCQHDTDNSSKTKERRLWNCLVIRVVNLTVASTHPAIVVGHSNEVVATGTGVGVDQELRHVQVSAGNTYIQYNDDKIYTLEAEKSSGLKTFKWSSFYWKKSWHVFVITPLMCMRVFLDTYIQQVCIYCVWMK